MIMQRLLRHFSRLELALIIFAILFRLLVISAATWYPISDTRDYYQFAYNLAHGEGYKQIYQGETAEFNGLTLYAFREPGYPVFLAILHSLLGWNVIWAYLSNVVFDIITLVLILALSKQLFGSTVSPIAGVLWAVNVLWTPNLMTESLFTALFTTLLWFVVNANDSYLQSRRKALLFGLLLTIAFFVRPIAVVLIPVVLYRWWRQSATDRHAGLKALACVLAPLVIASAAWAARNYVVLNAFVPLTTNFGTLNADSFGIDIHTGFKNLPATGLNEVKINTYFTQRIANTIVTQPIQAALVFAGRPFELFSLTPAWEIAGILLPKTFAGPNGSPLINQFYFYAYAFYYLVYPLAALGIVMALIRRAPISMLLLPLLSFTILQCLVAPGNMRFAAPLYPIICLFAAHSMTTLLRFLHARSKHRRKFNQPTA